MYFEIYGVDWSQIISTSDVIYDLRTFNLLEQMIFNLHLPIGETCSWWTSEINDCRLVRLWLLQSLRWINHSTLIVIKTDLKVRNKFITFACSAYFKESVRSPKWDLNFLFGSAAFKITGRSNRGTWRINQALLEFILNVNGSYPQWKFTPIGSNSN